MFAMKRVHLLSVAVLLALLATTAFAPGSAAAQNGQPLELPCVTGVTVMPIGQAMPDNANEQALVMLRLTIAPGGGFAAHTHPGTLVASIESGTFDLTQLDDMQMDVMRAATDSTPGGSEPMTKGVPSTLNPGDWFVEPGGMVHTGFNHGTEPTVVLLTGLVDPSKPLVQCLEGTPAA
jgi:quercetin dioxygenase-like cupin family protein